MKKQALTLAIAAALSAPSALAAQDTSGMHYTSASEGFYASLRLQLDSSNETKDGKNSANLGSGSSRIGVRGTNDLGGGLEGFYQWEGQITARDGDNSKGDNPSALRTRLGHVGIRGAFGELALGSFWTADYNWTHSSTDVANVYSGWLNYNARREARSEKAIQYTTPDLNGFKGAARVRMGGGTDGNDLDLWNLAATYAVQGFTMGASYNVLIDGLGSAATSARCTIQGIDATVDLGTPTATGNNPLSCASINLSGSNIVLNPTVAPATASTQEDLKSWTVRLGYAQDNWYVNGWYGVDSYDDAKVAAGATKPEQQTLTSLAGGVSLDKVSLYGVWEQAGDSGGTKGVDNTYATLGVQYNLGSRSRVWMEYRNQDLDSDKKADDFVNIGMRHDF